MPGSCCSAPRAFPPGSPMIGITDLRHHQHALTAVLIGAVYGFLPLMVPPIYVSLEKLDKRLLEASADLGATPVAHLLPGDAAAGASRRRNRLDAGLHPADGRLHPAAVSSAAERSSSSATRWSICSCSRATGPSGRPSRWRSSPSCSSPSSSTCASCWARPTGGGRHWYEPCASMPSSSMSSSTRRSR